MKKLFLVGISMAVIFSCGWIGSGCGEQAAARTESDRITEALARKEEGGFNYSELTSVDVAIESNGQQARNISVEYQVDNDQRDSAFRLHVLKLEGEQNLNNELMSPLMAGAPNENPLAEIVSMAKTLDARFLQDTLYAQLAGTWYKLSQEDYAASLHGGTGPDWEAFSCMAKAQLSDPAASLKTVNESFLKILSLKDVDKLGTEDIGGVATDHYRFSYNSDIDATKLMSAVTATPKAISDCDLMAHIPPPDHTELPPEVVTGGVPPGANASGVPPAPGATYGATITVTNPNMVPPGAVPPPPADLNPSPPGSDLSGMMPPFSLVNPPGLTGTAGGLAGLPPEIVEQMSNRYRTMLEGISTEIWIDAEDNVRRITVILKGNPDNMFGTFMPEPQKSGTSTMTITETFSDLDQELEIASPESGQPMKSLGEFLNRIESR